MVVGRPQPVWSQLYEVEGLRLTMTLREARLVHPDLRVKEIPYVDDHVGTDYEFFFGRIAALRYEGELLVERGERQGAKLELLFTGGPELYAVQAQVLEPGANCSTAIDHLVARYGRAMLDERPAYAAWRQVVVLGPELELRCLDDSRGFYAVTLRQPYLQELYLEDLARQLRPAIEAALQFVR